MSLKRHGAAPATRPAHVRRAAAFGLGACAGLVAALWVASVAGHGVRLSAGPLRVSATDPGRLGLEASVCLLIALLVAGSRRVLVWAALILVLVAAAADSTPRRVGDGAEYIAMALALSHGSPPALTDGELRDATAALDAAPGFEFHGSLAQAPLRSGGRQDFYHFWLYPLTVAPVLAVGRFVGLTFFVAFTLVNLAALALLAGMLVRRTPAPLAALVIVSPLMWWIDKAHAEIFLVTAVGVGLMVVRERPLVGVLALAAAGAQAPPLAPLWLAASIDLLRRQPARTTNTYAAVAASAALLLMPLAYYGWRLGVASPLKDATIQTWPGLRAWITPLVDLNLGMLWHAPALAGLTALGFARAWSTEEHEWRPIAVVAVTGAIGLLSAGATSGNINHGGTPGISRYAVWLIGMVVPFVSLAVSRVHARAPGSLLVISSLSIACSAYLFQPRWPDASGAPAPTALADWIWRHTPALDNPLPEVFAERVGGRDGNAELPVTTTRCEKVLLRAGGARWPVPCRPREIPLECRSPGRVCYANGGATPTFSVAPRQPSFPDDEDAVGTWTADSEAHVRTLLAAVGGDLHVVRPDIGDALVRGAPGVQRLHIVQGETGVAVWARPDPSSLVPPTLDLRVAVPMQAALYDPDTFEKLDPGVPITAGESQVAIPGRRDVLVIVTAITAAGSGADAAARARRAVSPPTIAGAIR